MSGDIGDKIAQFVSITDCSPQKAESYLKVSDYDLSNAVQLFFDTGGADMESTPSSPPPPLPARQAPGASNEPIQIDDGDDIENDDVREAMRASGQYVPSPPARGDYEDDETMARRLQEEFYGSGGGAASGMDNEVRAPIARTRETLVGGDEDDYAYPVRGGRAGICPRA